MGQFSWCTSDTKKSIPCTYDAYEGAPSVVYLLNPFGEPYKESDYDGYGKFGGRDVYELVVEWNREYLSAANIKKPKREEWAAGEEWDESFNAALARYNGSCEAIEAYAHGATDEQMKTQYGRFLSYLRDGSDWMRCLGIQIACRDEQHVKLRYPIKIVETPCKYEQAGISPHCPCQGCFYEDGRKAIQQSVDKAFDRLLKAQDDHMAEKIDALCDFFWKSHMEDVFVSEYKRGHFMARDGDGNRWKDAEIYDFVLNECLGFEPDGKLQFGYGAISQDLADTLKAHAAEYGIKPSIGLEAIVEAMAKNNDCIIVEADDLAYYDRNTGELIIYDSIFDDFIENCCINIYIAGENCVSLYKMLEETPDGIRMEYIGEADGIAAYLDTLPDSAVSTPSSLEGKIDAARSKAQMKNQILEPLLSQNTDERLVK